ncbi:MAG: cell division protein FtsZ [Parvicellaceae bacterium]|jgi:cell division protein FtsZ
MMKFNMPKDQSSIIKVIGVGGGGSNAVNHMYEQGIKGVDFVVCNTDSQALDISPVPTKIQLGSSLTEGRGAGSIPDVGKNAAIENIDDIKEILANNTKMVFVTAGMGGGTGTGAAPVIAKTAKEMGILTVGIVTVPFSFEGRKRKAQAELGIEAIRESVDTLLIINNDRLRDMFGNLTLQNAFAQADQVLSTAAKGIAEVISITGQINVDFNDVNTVMRDSGVAIMGSAVAEGDNRAIRAVEEALSSPLLNDNDIMGARYVLLNITYGTREVLMDEISDITDYIQDEAGLEADVIWGHGQDEELGDKLSVTLVATGFESAPNTGVAQKSPERVKRSIEDTVDTNITSPIQTPIESNLPKAEAPILAEVENNEVEAEPFIMESEVEAAEPVANVVLNETEEAVNEVESMETQSTFSFNMTNSETEETTEETTEDSGVKRYVLEDDSEESPLDTWVDSGLRAPTTEDSWDEQEAAKESENETPSLIDEEWEPTLRAEESEVNNVRANTESESELKEEVEDSWEPELTPSWTVNNSEEVTEEVNNEVVENVSNEEVVKPSFGFSASIIEEAENTTDTTDEISREDQEQLAEERIVRIKKISLKLKTPSGIADLEGEPAYKRRNIQLDDVEPSDEDHSSRLSLGENEEGKSGLNTGNSFLHDNVD